MFFNLKKQRLLLLNFVLISLIYISSIIYIDVQLDLSVFDSVHIQNLAVVLVFFLISILLRYYRWHLLMKHQGVDHKLLCGLLFYVSGFAYTATPGKVGELSRIFFYIRINVPSYIVVSSFILERFFDLIVVLFMAGFLLLQYQSFYIVAYAIFFAVLVIVFFAYNTKALKFICKLIIRLDIKKLSRLSLFVYLLSNKFRALFTFKITIFSLIIGVMAWSSTSFVFIYVCYIFELNIPIEMLYTIYPTAMLAGAVSFIPGGIGATEAVIIFLLDDFDTSLAISSTIAILVRFSTLWFAMFFGILCSILSSVYLGKLNE